MKAEYGLASLSLCIPALCVLSAWLDGPASWLVLGTCYALCAVVLGQLLPRVDRHTVS